MTDEEKIEKLVHAFSEVVWMAARYANGRSTYAPQMVRDAVNLVKEIDPSFKMTPDRLVQVPLPSDVETYQLKGDFLNDLYD